MVHIAISGTKFQLGSWFLHSHAQLMLFIHFKHFINVLPTMYKIASTKYN